MNNECILMLIYHFFAFMLMHVCTFPFAFNVTCVNLSAGMWLILYIYILYSIFYILCYIYNIYM